MKKLLLFSAALFCFTLSQAQLTGIEVEEYYVHPDVDLTTLAGPVNLFGYTTYRLYVTTANSNDYVSAVFGDGPQISQVQVTPDPVTGNSDMWQSPFAGPLATDLGCAFMASDESLVYDSFLTIGAESDCTPGGGSITAIGGNDDDEDFTATFEATGGFELSGQTGGLWFTLNDEFALGNAGDDNRVLIAQFTTNGCVSGTLWVQCFVGGVGTNEDIQSYDFTSCVGEVPGCTDDTALNYDAGATIDNNSCLYPCAIELDGEIEIDQPLCWDNNTGGISLDVTGFQQFSDFVIQGSEDPPLAVGNFNNLGNGTYVIEVYDAVCGSEEWGYDPVTFEVTLDTPELIITGEVIQDVTCLNADDAIVEGTWTGGTSPIMFGLAPDMLNQTDDAYFTGVDNGLTIIFAEDANGCLAQSNDMNVMTPSGFQVTAQSNQGATCSYTMDGSILCDWNGGTGPGITYSIDGENFQDSDFFENLIAGDYTVTAIDANGCEDTFEVTVNGPAELALDVTTVAATCNGDMDASVSFTAMGGNGGYMYSWNGATAGDVTEYTGLAAGDNDVVVTDSEGCEGMFVVSATEPDMIMFEVNETAILCNGDTNGAVEIVNVTGGTTVDGLYSYGIDGETYDEGSVFSGLGAGDIMPGVTDANGCEVTVDYTLSEPDAISVTVDATTEEQDGACDGSISVTVEGGTPDYTYTWTGPDGYTGNTEDITGLCDGDYFLNVEDENGCTYSQDVISVTVGVEELENGVSMTVYPNPTNGLINLTLEGLNGQDVTYTLTDVAGRTIESVQLNAASGLYTQVIDMSAEASGTYLMNLVVGNSTKSVRLIKH